MSTTATPPAESPAPEADTGPGLYIIASLSSRSAGWLRGHESMTLHGAVWAHSQDEAFGVAMQEAMRRCPKGEGWMAPEVRATRIDDKLVTAAAAALSGAAQ